MRKILPILAILLASAFVFSYIHNHKSFSYTFVNTQIRFPITVGEAMRAYHVLPHQYNRTGQPYTMPCPPNVPINGVSEVYYVEWADDYLKPPQDSTSRDVYAIKFCFNEQGKATFRNTVKQLETDFGQKFKLVRNKDSGEPFYELDASSNVVILIEFYPELMYKYDMSTVNNPRAWAVSFCYKAKGLSVEDYTMYERNYDAQ